MRFGIDNTTLTISLDCYRYTLTVWTGLNDKFPIEDLLPYRQEFDKSRVYYDLPDSQRSEFNKGMEGKT